VGLGGMYATKVGCQMAAGSFNVSPHEGTHCS
jgi:hypothetical protein